MYFVYFSCGAHAAYLELSLRSLARVRGSFVGRVYIGEDPDDPLSSEDKTRLGAIGLPLSYGSWGKVTGYGETTILSELQAFRDVAAGMNANDWIVKVDSDVLFLNNSAFGYAQHQVADLVGNKELAWGAFPYSQGGCYFLRAGWVCQSGAMEFGEVRAMAKDVLHRFHLIAENKNKWRMPQCPEDAFMHQFVGDRGGRIRLSNYYLPLWQVDRLMHDGLRLRLRKLGVLKALVAPRLAAGIAWHDYMLCRNRYSVIHFMSCKERMPAVFDILTAARSVGR